MYNNQAFYQILIRSGEQSINIRSSKEILKSIQDPPFLEEYIPAVSISKSDNSSPILNVIEGDFSSFNFEREFSELKK